MRNFRVSTVMRRIPLYELMFTALNDIRKVAIFSILLSSPASSHLVVDVYKEASCTLINSQMPAAAI